MNTTSPRGFSLYLEKKIPGGGLPYEKDGDARRLA